MKNLLLLLVLCCFFRFSARSQTYTQKPVTRRIIGFSFPKGQDIFFEGYHALKGIREKKDSIKAVAFFRQSAALGYGQAMEFLGHFHLYGLAGLKQNTDSAIYWYNASVAAHCAQSYFELGHMYQEGLYEPQDFKMAASYYRKGADLGSDLCKDYLGYLYYKGFGVPQSYDSAVVVYRRLAKKGNAHAEYFMGLLLRNGYGLAANADSARYWLKKSAAQNYKVAIHELLAEPLPENRTLVNAELAGQLKQLQQYKEKFKAADTNDISGHYTGYAVYQDFSRKGINKIVHLSVDLQKKGTVYVGAWTESGVGDKITASVSARFIDNTLIFDSSTQYVRRDQYSYESADRYRFDKARLNVQYFNDSIHFSGDMQFYSLKRREPGQPMFIALGRSNDSTVAVSQFNNKVLNSKSPMLRLYPNPAMTYINVKFSLIQNEKVQISIMDMGGRILQTKRSSSLPAGAYTYTFSLQGMVPGAYLLQVVTDSGKVAKLFIKN